MTQFYLIRHGEPDWSLADTKRLRGLQVEFCPLTQKGIQQSVQIAKNPILGSAEIVVSSPYTRALHTAAIITRELGLPLTIEYDLREWLPAPQLMYSRDELLKIMRDFKRYSEESPKAESKHWESMNSVGHRVRKVLEGYLEYSEVVVVCHGIVINSQIKGARLGYGELVELTLSE